MIRTCSISIKEASIIAVSALDDLVNDLVKASSLNMSPAFLDWVADEATSLVEWYVAHFFNSPRFANSLRMGAPRIAMARWVCHWVRHCVCPRIVVNFDQLAGGTCRSLHRAGLRAWRQGQGHPCMNGHVAAPRQRVIRGGKPPCTGLTASL